MSYASAPSRSHYFRLNLRRTRLADGDDGSLRAYLDARGYTGVALVFPPLELCTDNAAMIGWAGIEMYEAGWESELSCQSLNKWSLDPAAPDGGILGVGGWKRREGI